MKISLLMILSVFLVCQLLFGCGDSTVPGGGTDGDSDADSDGDSDGDSDSDSDPIEVGGFQWTELAVSSDSVTIYVSSSDGDPGNDCLSLESPCESLIRGESLLRDGYPDWLVLKRGDVWYESFSNGWSFSWTKSGRSADEPMVVTSYGDASEARPLIKAGQEHGFHRFRDTDLHDLALVDIHFESQTKNPHSGEYIGPAATENQSGFRFTGGGSVARILIEGCKFEYFGSNLAMHPSGSAPMFEDVKIRGNVFYSAWTGSSSDYSQGIYTDRVDGLFIEGNVFDRNGGLIGFTADPNGVQPPGLTEEDVTVTWYNHQAYIQSGNRNVTVINNIFANGDGMQLRPGGVAQNNLFTRTINALSIGSATTPVSGGVGGVFLDNVFLEGTDFAPASATPGVRANGILAANIGPDQRLIVDGNIFSHDMSEDRYGVAVGVNGQDCGSGNAYPCSVSHVEVINNVVYEWRGGFSVSGTLGSQVQDLDVSDNILQNPSDDGARLVNLSSGFDGAELSFSRNSYYRGGDANWFRIDGTPYDFSGWTTATGSDGESEGQQTFSAPDRGIAEYNASLGNAASHDDFMNRVREQAKGNWNPGLEALFVNDYIRAGFEP